MIISTAARTAGEERHAGLLLRKAAGEERWEMDKAVTKPSPRSDPLSFPFPVTKEATRLFDGWVRFVPASHLNKLALGPKRSA